MGANLNELQLPELQIQLMRWNRSLIELMRIVIFLLKLGTDQKANLKMLFRRLQKI